MYAMKWEPKERVVRPPNVHHNDIRVLMHYDNDAYTIA